MSALCCPHRVRCVLNYLVDGFLARWVAARPVQDAAGKKVNGEDTNVFHLYLFFALYTRHTYAVNCKWYYYIVLILCRFFVQWV